MASMIEEVANYQLDTPYIDLNSTNRFGEKEPALAYPVTFIFIDGEMNLDHSYLGYGWSETLESYKSFINSFNSLVNN